MIKTISKFKTSDGSEFTNKTKAQHHEKYLLALKNYFSFVKEVKDKGCAFANGDWHVKRDIEYVSKLYAAFKLVLQKYFKSYVKEVSQKTNWSTYNPARSGWAGRMLSDGNDPLYNYYCLIQNICSVCYREYGQQYYANNCKHDDSIPEGK